MEINFNLEKLMNNCFIENKEDIKIYVNNMISNLNDLLDYLKENEEEDCLTIDMKNSLYDTIFMLENSKLIENIK